MFVLRDYREGGVCVYMCVREGVGEFFEKEKVVVVMIRF